MHDEVSVRIEASPAAVWSLVSDVTRVGEFSPETFEAEWVGGASGPMLGAKFRGHVLRNGRPPAYWTDCVVTECVVESAFAFAVQVRGKTVNTWRYGLAASSDGAATDLTESFTLPNTGAVRLYWKVMGKARGRTNRNGMQTTLGRIKAVAEG